MNTGRLLLGPSILIHGVGVPTAPALSPEVYIGACVQGTRAVPGTEMAATIMIMVTVGKLCMS